MNQKALQTLEFYKIIERLTDFAHSEPGKKLCRELVPSSDFHEIVQNQTETADAVSRVRMKGSLSFAGVSDVGDSLKRLEIGGSLSAHELLSISGLLTCAARAKNYGRHPESQEIPDDSLDGMFRALEPLTASSRLPRIRGLICSIPTTMILQMTSMADMSLSDIL